MSPGARRRHAVGAAYLRHRHVAVLRRVHDDTRNFQLLRRQREGFAHQTRLGRSRQLAYHAIRVREQHILELSAHPPTPHIAW